MRTRLVRPSESAWEECLQDIPRDVYHTAGFHLYSEGSGEGRAFMAVIGDRRRGLAWPYLLRAIADVPGLAESEATDATSVYGYPGPLAWGCEPGDQFLLDAWRELLGLWRDQLIVTVFTRLHPLLGNASLVTGLRVGDGTAADAAAVQPLGETVSIDCTIDDEAAQGLYDRRVRQAVDRGRRDGLVTIEDESWADLGKFVDLYRETMQINNAAAYYFFSHSDLARLREALPAHVHLLATYRDGTMVAAGILTEFRGIVQTYLSASDRRVHPSPKPLFYDDARRWARARGNHVLHLGGGRGSRADSLLEFKARFSPIRHTFSIGRWVIDDRAYRELVEARLARQGPSDPLDHAYFPAYRDAPPDAPPSQEVGDDVR